MQVVGCKHAKALGLKRYFTGKPCKRGHVAERHVTGGCVVCANEDQRRYYDQDPEKYRALNRAYFQNDDVRERNRLRQAEFYKSNPELFRAISSRCRAERMKRVPPWAELEAIRAFYAACPQGQEVDHTVPLQGRTVSGLHVLANLQYLTMPQNRSKGNKF